MKTIKTIQIQSELTVENTLINGDFTGGNMKVNKKDSNGNIYCSGQRRRHGIMETVDSNNNMYNGTYCSNSDGVTTDISKDLSADFRGFLEPKGSNYLYKRNSPIYSSFGVSNPNVTNVFFTDTLTGLGQESKNQAIVNVELVKEAALEFFESIDVSRLGRTTLFEYIDNKHINSINVDHIDLDEKVRRIFLFLDAIEQGHKFSNAARCATSTYPDKVIITVQETSSVMISKFFTKSKQAQDEITNLLDRKNIKYFIGRNMTEVCIAFENAKQYIEENKNLIPIDTAPSHYLKSLDELIKDDFKKSEELKKLKKEKDSNI